MTTLLRAYWPHLLVAAVLVGMFVTILLVSAERDTARAERDTAQLTTALLRTQLENQNDGIQALADAADANREVYLAGLAAANRTATRLEIRAEDFLAMPAPTNPDDRCEAARSILEEVTQ